MTILRRLLRSEQAASAAEFALVLPLLLLLLFAIIDAGRFMWEFNEAEKATQAGVRYAVVTDPVLGGTSSSTGLYNYSFSLSGGITQGTAVPTTSFDTATCTSGACTCLPGGGFCSGTAYNATAFTNLVTRMSKMYPQIKASNVQIQYKNVGLGFAGDPDGPDVSPLVTVSLTGLQFHPLTCLVFACSITMPDFRAGLTLEDATGTESN
jgi:Flp pilus assembly protein TadG